jgi:glycosyltransferase involved in cell wall biosynthesis
MKNRKPNILYISGSWPPIKCGVSDYMYNLTKFINSNWSLITSTSADGDDKVFNIVPNWQFSDWGLIRAKIYEINPDIIHYEYPSTQYGRKPFSNFLPYYIQKHFPQLPLIATIHEYHDASKLGKKRIEFTLGPFSNVFVSNIEDQKELGSKFPRKQFKLVRIGSNISVAKLGLLKKRRISNELNPNNKKLIVYFGYIDPSKGVGNLIDSMAKWSDDTRLILATEYNPQNSYHKELNKKIIASNKDIYWTGYMVSEKISVTLQLADIVVLPFNQPISMRRGSLIAALSHGCTIVTTGPATEVLIDRKNCWLMPDNTPINIARAVNGLLGQPKLAKLIGLNAKKTSQQFSWKEIAKRHDNEYQRFLT